MEGVVESVRSVSRKSFRLRHRFVHVVICVSMRVAKSYSFGIASVASLPFVVEKRRNLRRKEVGLEFVVDGNVAVLTVLRFGRLYVSWSGSGMWSVLGFVAHSGVECKSAPLPSSSRPFGVL